MMTLYTLVPYPAHLALWITWNLSLAWFPVLLAFRLVRGLRRDLDAGRVRWLLWLPLLLIWLLFLPNTAYLLTEWRHYLDVVSRDPQYALVYRDGLYPPDVTLTLLILTAFYLLYSALGLLALFLAVHPLSHLAAEHWSRARLRTAQGVIFALCSVGTYLGLVNRFNSWDILRRHMAPVVLGTISSLPGHPVLLLVLLAFAALLWLFYTLFTLCLDGLRLRREMSRRTLPQV